MKQWTEWRKKRWIEEVGENRQYLDPNIDFIFYPYDVSKGLNKTKFRDLLVRTRPAIHGAKQVRIAKDNIYRKIFQSLKESETRGPYIGLAAAYIPEIYTALYPHVRDEFITCQNQQADYQKIFTWIDSIDIAYITHRGPSNCRPHHPQFRVFKGDILDLMKTTKKKYAVIDLDLMAALNEKLIDSISTAVTNCAQSKSVLVVWHGANRRKGTGDKLLEKQIRPKLVTKLEHYFRIEKHTIMKYSEAQPGATHGYPMRVDILALQRK